MPRSISYASVRGARSAAKKGEISGGEGGAAGEGIAESEFSFSVSLSSGILLVFQYSVYVCKATRFYHRILSYLERESPSHSPPRPLYLGHV